MIEPVRRPWRQPVQKPAKIVHETKPKRTDRNVNKGRGKPLTVKDAAVRLGVSYTKAKKLFEARKTYSVASEGKFVVPPGAVEHFVRDGTPLQFVEIDA